MIHPQDNEALARVAAFVQAVKAITGHTLPGEMLIWCRWHPAHRLREDLVYDPLQNWIGERMPDWMSAIGIIEAAEILVETAIEVSERDFLARFGVRS